MRTIETGLIPRREPSSGSLRVRNLGVGLVLSLRDFQTEGATAQQKRGGVHAINQPRPTRGERRSTLTTTPEAVATQDAIVLSGRTIANRQNAPNSTGPKTPHGKNNSKYNARKHGILAKETLAGIGKDRKARAEFSSLLASFREYCSPVGPLEDMQVDIIVNCYWRLGLLRHFERQEADRAIRIDGAELPFRGDGDQVSIDILQQIRQDPEGVALKLDRGQKLIEESIELIRSHGYLQPEELDRLRAIPGDLWQRCVALYPDGDMPHIFFGDNLGELSLDGDRILQELTKEQPWLRSWKEICLRVQRNPELRALVARPDLPGPEAMELIIRYQSHILRQLYRAMDQLERLQRRRQGEFVQPPVSARVEIEQQ